MTPEHYNKVICDFLDHKLEEYKDARTFVKRNLKGIMSHAPNFQARGGGVPDPLVRTASRAFFYAAYVYGPPVGLFNIVMGASQGITVARIIAAYCDFIEKTPYFTTLDSLLQLQRLAWGDSEVALPVSVPAIIAYDGECALRDYAGVKALEEFSRKINPSQQVLLVFSEEPFDYRPPKSNGKNTVYFKQLNFGIIDFPGLIEEKEDDGTRDD